MRGKIRLYAEVDGTLIPISIPNEQIAFETLGIKELPLLKKHEKDKNKSGTSTNGYSISSYRQLTTGDIIKYLLDNIEESHTVRSVAEYFGVDVGKGKKKTIEQKLAYDKLYRNFRTARTHVTKRLSGEWVRSKKGFFPFTAVWHFKENETGT